MSIFGLLAKQANSELSALAGDTTLTTTAQTLTGAIEEIKDAVIAEGNIDDDTVSALSTWSSDKITDETTKDIYTIDVMPIYMNRYDFAKLGLFNTMTLLDVGSVGLATPYGQASQDFYRYDLATLQSARLLSPGVTSPSSDPYWFCAKLIQRYAIDYHFIWAWSYNHKLCYRFSTNGAIKTPYAAQTLGWLRNTGFEVKPNATTGLGSGMAMYGEYTLDDFPFYNDKNVVKVWKSTGLISGTCTWADVLTLNGRNHPTEPQVYHFHYVRNDPYNRTHWYVGTGDLPSESNMYFSPDDGVTWYNVNDPAMTGELQQIHRTCNLYFTEDYIYWGTDGFIEGNGSDPDPGCVWVRTPRPEAEGTITIEILADVKNWVRQILPTPFGVFLTTEKRPYDTTHAFAWLVKYDDLTKPILIGKTTGTFGSSQLMEDSYGNRIFIQDTSGIDRYTLGGITGDSNFAMMTLHKSVGKL